MKIILSPGQYNFTPSLNQVDFTPFPGFAARNLLAVINITTEKLVYSVASGPSGYGGSFVGSVLTYDSSNAGQNASDILQIIYDDATIAQNVNISSGSVSSFTFDYNGNGIGSSIDPATSDYRLFTDSLSKTLAGDGTPVLTTYDVLSGEDGLNVNLLNSSFGGQIGSSIPVPNQANALSVGFLNGSTLATPLMDPVTNKLQINADITSSVPIDVNLAPTPSIQTDVLGADITGMRNNQLEISFNSAPGASLISNSFTGAGSVTIANGHSIYQCGGAGAVASARADSVQTTVYRPAHEVYSCFTAAFTDMILTRSTAKIGLFDSNNGFFVGFDSTQGYCIGSRVAGVDTIVAQANFNVDTLSGGVGSKFTRNGVPEAIDFGLSNLFRIRFAWLGSANIYYEVFSPDGEWVLFHNIRQPNSAYNPSIANPNLPMSLIVSKTTGTQNSAIATACWSAGTTSDTLPLDQTLTDKSLAKLTRTVIEGKTTGGGGGYVPVKVNPSGALTVEAAATLTSPIPVTTEVYITGASANSATPASGTPGAGTNLLLAVAGTGSVDATGHRTCTVQVALVAGTSPTFPTFNFEYSNNNIDWVNFAVFRPDSVSPNAITGDITPASATPAIVYSFPVLARYIRLRLRAAPGGAGTVRAFTRLSPMAWSPTAVNVINATAANLNATVSGSVSATVSGSLTSAGSVTQATPSNLNCTAVVVGATIAASVNTDINAASVTTTAVSATITPTNAQSAAFALVVTVTSGSGTLDVTLQEAQDGTASPTLWENIYSFERITTAKRIYIPAMRLSGTNLRLNYVVSGTVNYSVTLLRTTRQVSAPMVRRLFDRSVTPNTTPSASSALWVEGCDEYDMIVSMGAGGVTAPIFQMQGSEDGTDWFNMGTTMTATIGATTSLAISDGSLPKFIRAQLATAGSGSTLNYVVIKGKSSG